MRVKSRASKNIFGKTQEKDTDTSKDTKTQIQYCRISSVVVTELDNLIGTEHGEFFFGILVDQTQINRKIV